MLGLSLDKVRSKLGERGIDPLHADVRSVIVMGEKSADTVYVVEMGKHLLNQDSSRWNDAQSLVITSATQFADWMTSQVCARLPRNRPVLGVVGLEASREAGYIQFSDCASVGLLCDAGLGFCVDPFYESSQDELDQRLAGAAVGHGSLGEHLLSLLTA